MYSLSKLGRKSSKISDTSKPKLHKTRTTYDPTYKVDYSVYLSKTKQDIETEKRSEYLVSEPDRMASNYKFMNFMSIQDSPNQSIDNSILGKFIHI